MQWIHQFQLFLFDLDGLLVDTERVHYRAYQEMCRGRGEELPWTFSEYCAVAHYSDTGIRDGIYALFPRLKQEEPDWGPLYEEKRNAYLRLLQEEPVPLMPEVGHLLKALQEANVTRCVVTHSAKPLVDHIRAQNPILNTISHWFTREDYRKAKPDPDGYLTAIHRLGRPGDRVIGFEDSPRGLMALQATPALPVWICPKEHPAIQDGDMSHVLWFENFGAIPSSLEEWPLQFVSNHLDGAS